MLADKIIVIVYFFYLVIVLGSYVRIKIDNNLNKYTYLAVLFMPILCIVFVIKRLPIIVSLIGREIYTKTKK